MQGKITLKISKAKKTKGEKINKKDIATMIEQFSSVVLEKSEENENEKKDTVTILEWPGYHANLLQASVLRPDWIFQDVVERPTVKFKIYYCGGRTQICETLCEKFKEKSLI